MWYAATSEAKEPNALAVALAEVKARLLINHEDDDDDLTAMIREATAYVETYCNIRLLPQTLTCECDGWRDFSRLPDGPISANAVTVINYVDGSGAAQTLSTDAYRVLHDGLEAQIAPKAGKVWPVAHYAERIKLTIDAGYVDAVPCEVRAAILLRVATSYQNRENVTAAPWTEFDSLLVNFRRGA
ncbi:head-tail connector protein [Agrobacterium larrymoorei]|uniref:PhiE125 gp8 family phage protein n=1 Tax=Agrobacterium larrymoorei TaxID=160699 RepID=A0ABU0UF69_9HYPH|nr:phage head-tail connector protein [Agrobacterium larrymoorei]MDQ1183576.1 putative phiE125 gp8 family phage protein [Agrobacterium larrymoorei]